MYDKLRSNIKILSHILQKEVTIIFDGLHYHLLYVENESIIYTSSKKSMEAFVSGMLQMYVERG